MSLPEMEDLLVACRALVARTATFIAEHNVKQHQVEHKADNSLVSYVDRKAEEGLIAGLKELLPKAGFLAEESAPPTNTNHEWLWVIDPLDGTTNFVHGLPCYCISLALFHHEESVLGIVHDIAHKDCYWALRGKGAYRNETPLRVSDTAELQNALVAVGLLYKSENETKNHMKWLLSISAHARGWRRLGSAAMQLAYVSAGMLDAYLDTDLKPWDVAAGQLLVEEAGGHLTTPEGKTYRREDGHLLAGGAVHPQLLRLIQAA